MVHKFRLIRPDDLLNLQVEAHNLRLDTPKKGDPALTPEDAGQPAYLVFIFPPQTIAESAFYEFSETKPPAGQPNPEAGDTAADTEPLPPPGSVRASLGGPSRLVFRIPAGAGSADVRIPFTWQGLLDWAGLELSVSALADIPPAATPAQVTSAPGIQEPKPLETALELPYRLVLSPNHAVAWRHATLPVTHKGRTELWHTRLALKDDKTSQELSPGNTAALRAIWSPDYNPFLPPAKKAEDAFLGRSAMSPNDRHQIVILTSAFKGYRTRMFPHRLYRPQPIFAERLMLTPLGGWLRSRGNWDPPEVGQPTWSDVLYVDKSNLPALLKASLKAMAVDETPVETANLEAAALSLTSANLASRELITSLVRPKQETLDLSEWVHRAAQGRDHYVRIVYEGNLHRLGHRASLVKVTERRFMDTADGPVAYLIQYMFIVIREPVKEYPAHLYPYQGRELPLKRIRLTTLVTPHILDPYAPPSEIAASSGSFWVMYRANGVNQDFKFHAIAEDIAGNQVEFTASLIFMPFSEEHPEQVKAAYDASGERRKILIPGQKLTYAPRDTGLKSDNTTIDTKALYLGALSQPTNLEYGKFVPTLLSAQVSLPSVEQITGGSTPTFISFYPKYLADGLTNAGGVFAQIADAAGVPAKLPLDLAADKAGGISTPNAQLTSLSRQFGPLAGEIEDAAKNLFDPAKFFQGVTAELFGAIDLFKLIVGNGKMDENAPKYDIQTEDVPQGRKVIALLTWKPKVKHVDAGILALLLGTEPNVGLGPTTLDINGRIEKIIPLPGGVGAIPEPYSRFSGKMDNFGLEFLRVVLLRFKSFTFTAESKKKTDVNVQLDHNQPVTFEGDLEFVEELRKLIPPGLFGDGPYLDINASRVRAGFNLALPPAAVGIFAIQNISLGAYIELPFVDGRPLFDFAFASRADPFLITVAFLGGGGFFHLQIDTKGIKQLEAAFEFGATAAINLGVASGSVHIMAGIYFKMEMRDGENASVLSGYLRMGGELSVLGIISVSLEFMLSFTYDSSTGKASGRATLTVEIEILFFSMSVELTVERSFGRDGGDPTFAQLYDSPGVWAEYAEAFA